MLVNQKFGCFGILIIDDSQQKNIEFLFISDVHTALLYYRGVDLFFEVDETEIIEGIYLYFIAFLKLGYCVTFFS